MNAGDELNRFATYEQVVEIVERQDSVLWKKWFAKVPAIPAGLSVRTDVVDSGYSEEKNLIVIGIGETFDLEPTILSVAPITEFTCAPWMTCLVHEMLHEYEHKVVIFPSDEGREFYSVYKEALQFRFGAGHEERFCTALVTCSEFLAVPANRLLTMVHDTRRVNRIGIAQGVYYLMTALWPFFSLRTFIAVTGPKTDVWLVKTVGALLVVIGIALIVGSNSEEIKPDTICLGVFSALALALIDIYYALRKIISKIYLGEAAVELIFVFLWIGFLCFGNLTNPSR